MILSKSLSQLKIFFKLALMAIACSSNTYETGLEKDEDNPKGETNIYERSKAISDLNPSVTNLPATNAELTRSINPEAEFQNSNGLSQVGLQISDTNHFETRDRFQSDDSNASSVNTNEMSVHSDYSGTSNSINQLDSNQVNDSIKPTPIYSTRDFSYGKLLGLGSFSKVVKVTLKSTNEVFALKIMDKKHIIREKKVPYVKREKHILSSLNHHGVVKLHFTFQDEQSLYLGLECCGGGELFKQINLKGRLSLKEAQYYAAEIVLILEYIHSQGIIHRDLKPENLLLDAFGRLKISDFGSAKIFHSIENNEPESQSEDRNSSFVGTAEYVSPEVLKGLKINYAVDMWALGCIIYQMLHGSPPFKAKSEYLCFQKVLNRDFQMPEYFSPPTIDIINKLLEVDSNSRLGSNPNEFPKIKSHPFFEGIDWENLKDLPPPVLAQGTFNRVSMNEAMDEEWELGHLGGQLSAISFASLYKQNNLVGQSSSSHLEHSSSSSSFSSPPSSSSSSFSNVPC